MAGKKAIGAAFFAHYGLYFISYHFVMGGALALGKLFTNAAGLVGNGKQGQGHNYRNNGLAGKFFINNIGQRQVENCRQVFAAKLPH